VNPRATIDRGESNRDWLGGAEARAMRQITGSLGRAWTAQGNGADQGGAVSLREHSSCDECDGQELITYLYGLSNLQYYLI
jgi:hypothetical protein